MPFSGWVSGVAGIDVVCLICTHVIILNLYFWVVCKFFSPPHPVDFPPATRIGLLIKLADVEYVETLVLSLMNIKMRCVNVEIGGMFCLNSKHVVFSGTGSPQELMKRSS